MNPDRTEHEKRLYRIFGIQHFYDEQWEAIRRILMGDRILMIQRTGFGKSLCYQYPATVFDGVTVIFSPLIALMRDQVDALNARGIAARYINSEQTYEENLEAMQEALDGKVKILYIAPERQENSDWVATTHDLNLSMVVVDEAHTISMWGHDFRPAFRRIEKLVSLLPYNMPVLATTATATKRVQNDIERQTGIVNTFRGPLCRTNFRLYVIRVSSEDEKMVWLAQHLNEIDGTGLIYTGTRVDTEVYAKWLSYNGINAVNYNAGHDADTRKEIEIGLKKNRYKCVVSTNALGMGIDKPDIRFIIHTQIPASPIHYYQEIGRAGRDGKPTTIILFFNETEGDDGTPVDKRLPKAFIDGARPSRSKYLKAIEALQEEPLNESGLMRETNLKQTAVRVIRADLIDQGIAHEVGEGRSKKLEYRYGAPELDTRLFEELRQAKLRDLDSMIDYVYTSQPRMQFLCRFLDDDSATRYANCDNTNLEKHTVAMTDHWREIIRNFRESYFPVLETDLKTNKMANGVAASYYGTSNVGRAIHRSKYEGGGDFPDFLLRLTLKAFHRTFGKEHFDLVVYVPPTHSGDLVKHFAIKFADALNIPLSHNLVKKRSTNEQKIFQNSYLKRDNVKGAFDYANPDEIRGKRILLVDDIYDSGATIKEIGKLLSTLDAEQIVPITIAKTVGGDIA
ncbi:MAG: RecQ family ATP-dependent DNA helicase [Bacteroidales bacterium]|nr:RecQ family ATP-dependent DNA helicase [Bacteroidales bacterium]